MKFSFAIIAAAISIPVLAENDDIALPHEPDWMKDSIDDGYLNTDPQGPKGIHWITHAATFYTGFDCTGKTDKAGPHPNFQCDGKCWNSFGARSVLLEAQWYWQNPEEIYLAKGHGWRDSKYNRVHINGPAVVGYHWGECRVENMVAEAHIPKGKNRACVNFMQTVHSYQARLKRKCKKEGRKNKKEDRWRTPEYVNWNDPDTIARYKTYEDEVERLDRDKPNYKTQTDEDKKFRSAWTKNYPDSPGGDLGGYARWEKNNHFLWSDPWWVPKPSPFRETLQEQANRLGKEGAKGL
ncbi:hypothetical protein S7711_11214 [Stachybotrys chartarum IBT 7711]|uniref:Uncharacterized protein n=1 Tax=Stachybotrys chartarum (strain CBS 109288 / IBT 7711) TaxID=1280523 RepID=A0A084AHL4_STACB|nr:hypothetical protein S7711_11214 [Stachybotrys chartarum IBT 7711]KFA48602.1 hypothetical protein S40293_10380 [Stachybotrys chartarum IBT 40293]KFA74855.1 hypothetical protein S40288_10806 [Stachybotrys chartarum IBT 40288]